MQQNAAFLSALPLFRGFSAQQVTQLLSQCGAHTLSYSKDQCAIRRGERIGSIGILLSGEMLGQTVTAQGALTTVSHMLPGAVFGDVLSGSSGVSPVTVTAQQESSVLWLELAHVLSPEGGVQQLKTLFLRNLIETISDKYFALSARVELLCERSLRSRIARYLLVLRQKNGSDSFLLPHAGRAQLADYLACERSALCRELSRMQHEGLLALHKRQVQLLDIAALELL